MTAPCTRCTWRYGNGEVSLHVRPTQSSSTVLTRSRSERRWSIWPD
jgi:hypothetical protein